MNLMFRKNFREGKSGGGAIKCGKASGNRHASKRSSREQGYTPMEEHHYRTHLFFSPPRTSYTNEEIEEPRCGPVTGAGGEPLPISNAMPTGILETDLPQPLIVRSPSVSILGWPSSSPANKTHSTRQVSFNANKNNGQTNIDTVKTLTGLGRDCFVIPVHSLDRFLPAGVSLPKQIPSSNSLERRPPGNLHVMEVPDPKLCVLCHLMSPFEPIDPMLESPLVPPISKQRLAATELINEISQAKTAVTGMLLANLEKLTEFPFITYYVINTSQTNPVLFYNNLRTSSLSKFDPRTTRYTAAHTLDLYAEVASIYRPPIHEIGVSLNKSHTSMTGYMVSVYKVFEGDDREKFERNWLYWTGARMIYRYLPHSAGLRRITLHKSLSPKGDKMYILICECSNLLSDITVCALLLPALRARLTGYTGIFRPIQTF